MILFSAAGTNQTDATDPCVTAINIGDYRRSTAYVPSGVLLQDTDLDSSNFGSVIFIITHNIKFWGITISIFVENDYNYYNMIGLIG